MARRAPDPQPPAAGLTLTEKIALGAAGVVAAAGVVVAVVAVTRKPIAVDPLAGLRASGIPLPNGGAPSAGPGAPAGPDNTARDVATGVDAGVKIAGTVADLAAAL